MCRHIVIVHQPVSILPHLTPFVPHIFPQSSQNLTVQLSFDSLTRWNNALNVIYIYIYIYIYKKKKQHWLDVTANLARLFWSQRGWRLPLRRLLLCFWIIIIQPDSSPVMTLDRKLGSSLTAFCSSVHT